MYVYIQLQGLYILILQCQARLSPTELMTCVVMS